MLPAAAGTAALQIAVEAVLARFAGEPLTGGSYQPSFASLHASCVAIMEALPPHAVAGAECWCDKPRDRHVQSKLKHTSAHGLQAAPPCSSWSAPARQTCMRLWRPLSQVRCVRSCFIRQRLQSHTSVIYAGIDSCSALCRRAAGLEQAAHRSVHPDVRAVPAASGGAAFCSCLVHTCRSSRACH